MEKGFTLIELLVVVLIIGILAAVALPQYQKAVMKSRAVEIVTFLENVDKSVELLRLENGGLDNFSFRDLNHDYSSQLNCEVNATSSLSTCTSQNGKWSLTLTVMAPANIWMLSLVPVGMDVNSVGIGSMNGTYIRGCEYKKNSSQGKMFCDAVAAFDKRYTATQGAS